MSKIVVVGANHAGTACINKMLVEFGDKNEIVVFDQNSNISFLGCGMALWIGKQISGPEGLFYSNKEKLEAAGAKVHMNSPVEFIDFDKKEVHVLLDGTTKHVESYDKLILATGSQPILPPIKGAEIVPGNREFKATLENLQFVKLYQNSEEVIEKLNTNPAIKRVAVVGAGYIGVELAEAFQRLGKEVTLVDIVDTCLAGYYDRDLTDLMSKNLEEHGIRLAFGQKVEAVEGNGKVERLVTDKETFDVDMVVLAVGFRPNTALGADKLELFRNGAYLVNKKQETSIKDVYAIGDCATVYDNSINDTNYIALATNAVRSGLVAAINAGGDIEFESIGVQGSNGICIYDLKMVSTGLTLEKAKRFGYNAVVTEFADTQKPAFIEHDNHEVKLKIVYDKDTRVVLGAQMASKEDMSMGIHMFSLAIQEKVTIDRLALLDIFFLPHFNQPYNYITMAALSAK